LLLQQGARRENILHGSVTDEQRRRSGKDRQPCGQALAGALRRCSSVTERFGYVPSLRLAMRPPELSAPNSYL
jgi:hypothetical protein